MSHDLRNPLNVAQGNVDVAAGADDPSAALADAAAALDRMERLIEDLLTLAREGETVDDPQQTSLEARARTACGAVQTPDATLTVASDRSILADPGRLEQLLSNLFRNAVEHGGAGVAVTVEATADGFAVADDGPGIPETDRETVFESGFTTNPDGTGFGLAIVKEIADAHGWTVSVREAESGGARFEIVV